MRFLRATKFDAQEAFEIFVNYYNFMHRNHQNFYVGYNVNNPEVCLSLLGESDGNLRFIKYYSICFELQVRGALEDGLPGVLETRDRRGRRIMVIFAAQWDLYV